MKLSFSYLQKHVAIYCYMLLFRVILIIYHLQGKEVKLEK